MPAATLAVLVVGLAARVRSQPADGMVAEPTLSVSIFEGDCAGTPLIDDRALPLNECVDGSSESYSVDNGTVIVQNWDTIGCSGSPNSTTFSCGVCSNSTTGVGHVLYTCGEEFFYPECRTQQCLDSAGDGTCDGTCFWCGFDGGDCRGIVFCDSSLSDCFVDQIGDGVCDPECLFEECEFDRGDCDPSPTDPACAVGCDANEVGNGICDDACHVEECSFDGGDCATPSNTPIPGCAPGCLPEMVGNGECDRGCFNVFCSFDLGDCNTQSHSESASTCSPGCSWPDLGDGWCNEACNVTACDFDNGDCSFPTGSPLPTETEHVLSHSPSRSNDNQSSTPQGDDEVNGSERLGPILPALVALCVAGALLL